MDTKKPTTIRKYILWSLLIIIVSQLTMGVLLLIPVFVLKEKFPVDFVVGMAGITEAIVIFILIKVIDKGEIRPFKNLYKGNYIKLILPDFTLANIFNFIAIAILIPIAEEVLFRAFLLHQLLKQYSPTTSILVVGMLFTLAHLFPFSSYFSFFLFFS